MADLTENPYTPPNTLSALPVGVESPPSRPSILLRVVRGLILGVIGYAVYVGVATFYCNGPFRSLNATPDWTSGSLLALVFASSEVLNSGRGHSGGIVRRMLIASALMLAVVLVVGVLGTAAGFRARNYSETDRVGNVYTGIFAVVFPITLFAIKLNWIRDR
jgi:hypothetical protein